MVQPIPIAISGKAVPVELAILSPSFSKALLKGGKGTSPLALENVIAKAILRNGKNTAFSWIFKAEKADATAELLAANGLLVGASPEALESTLAKTMERISPEAAKTGSISLESHLLLNENYLSVSFSYEPCKGSVPHGNGWKAAKEAAKALGMALAVSDGNGDVPTRQVSIVMPLYFHGEG